ncbi:MAG: DUF6660 family protein [Sediminibacterium sp.]
MGQKTGCEIGKNSLIFHLLQPYCHFRSLFLLKIAIYPAIFASMKFLFFFLGFSLLYLSCLACSDSTECNAKSESKISASANHQAHNHSKEACTPFCTCSCCAATAFYHPLSKVQFVKIIFRSEKDPFDVENFNSEVSYSIWQPPKLTA